MFVVGFWGCVHNNSRVGGVHAIKEGLVQFASCRVLEWLRRGIFF